MKSARLHLKIYFKLPLQIFASKNNSCRINCLLTIVRKLWSSDLIGLHNVIFGYQAHVEPLGFKERANPPINMRLFINVDQVPSTESKLVSLIGGTVPQGLVHICVVDRVRFFFGGSRWSFVNSCRYRRCWLSARLRRSVGNFLFCEIEVNKNNCFTKRNSQSWKKMDPLCWPIRLVSSQMKISLKLASLSLSLAKYLLR